MVFRSPELLEYSSDHNAEGVTNPGTDQLYLTPPMQGASPIILDSTLSMHEESPAKDCVADTGTLVPIQEVDEIKVKEVSEVPM